MNAITTRYAGPTNSRGSRYIARCEGRRITVPADYSKNSHDNHAAACRALLLRLGWTAAVWVGGHTYDGKMVWVDRSYPDRVMIKAGEV